MKRIFNGIDCCYWSMLLFSIAQAVPVTWNEEFNGTGEHDISERPYLTNQVCLYEEEVYTEGQTRQSPDPCETCTCQPPSFTCKIRTCEVKLGCKALHSAGKCCPNYMCDCHKNGRTYGNGEKVEEPNPCNVCYCKGGEIKCAGVSCYTREDCEPHYVPGKCCPKYDHCPAIEMKDRLPMVPSSSENINSISIDSSTPRGDNTTNQTMPVFVTAQDNDQIEITTKSETENRPSQPQVGTLEIIEIYPNQKPNWQKPEVVTPNTNNKTIPEINVIKDETKRTTEPLNNDTIKIKESALPLEVTSLETLDSIEETTSETEDAKDTSPGSTQPTTGNETDTTTKGTVSDKDNFPVNEKKTEIPELSTEEQNGRNDEPKIDIEHPNSKELTTTDPSVNLPTETINPIEKTEEPIEEHPLQRVDEITEAFISSSTTAPESRNSVTESPHGRNNEPKMDIEHPNSKELTTTDPSLNLPAETINPIEKTEEPIEEHPLQRVDEFITEAFISSSTTPPESRNSVTESPHVRNNEPKMDLEHPNSKELTTTDPSVNLPAETINPIEKTEEPIEEHPLQRVDEFITEAFISSSTTSPESRNSVTESPQETTPKLINLETKEVSSIEVKDLRAPLTTEEDGTTVATLVVSSDKEKGAKEFLRENMEEPTTAVETERTNEEGLFTTAQTLEDHVLNSTESETENVPEQDLTTDQYENDTESFTVPLESTTVTIKNLLSTELLLETTTENYTEHLGMLEDEFLEQLDDNIVIENTTLSEEYKTSATTEQITTLIIRNNPSEEVEDSVPAESEFRDINTLLPLEFETNTATETFEAESLVKEEPERNKTTEIPVETTEIFFGESVLLTTAEDSSNSSEEGSATTMQSTINNAVTITESPTTTELNLKEIEINTTEIFPEPSSSSSDFEEQHTETSTVLPLSSTTLDTVQLERIAYIALNENVSEVSSDPDIRVTTIENSLFTVTTTPKSLLLLDTSEKSNLDDMVVDNSTDASINYTEVLEESTNYEAVNTTTYDFNTTEGYEINENSSQMSENDGPREYTLTDVEGNFPRKETPEKMLAIDTTEETTTAANPAIKRLENTTTTLAEILLKWLQSKKAKSDAKNAMKESGRTFDSSTNNPAKQNTTSNDKPVNLLSVLTTGLLRIVNETFNETEIPIMEETNNSSNDNSRMGALRSLDFDNENDTNDQSLDIYGSDIENLAEALGKDSKVDHHPVDADIPIHLKYPFTDESLAPVLSMISDQLQFLKIGEEQPVYIDPPPEVENTEHRHGVVIVPTAQPITVHMVKVIDGVRGPK